MIGAIERRALQVAMAARRRMAMLRARSYRAVFRPDPLPGPGQAGLARDAEIVLADLREFCAANRTTFTGDASRSLVLQGRREAWLRIVQHLNLDEAAIMKLVEVDDGLGE